MANQSVLPSEVAAEFKLVKGAPVAFFDKQHGDVDFRKISLEKAAELADAECPHIERSKKTTSAS